MLLCFFGVWIKTWCAWGTWIFPRTMYKSKQMELFSIFEEEPIEKKSRNWLRHFSSPSGCLFLFSLAPGRPFAYFRTSKYVNPRFWTVHNIRLSTDFYTLKIAKCSVGWLKTAGRKSDTTQQSQSINSFCLSVIVMCAYVYSTEGLSARLNIIRMCVRCVFVKGAKPGSTRMYSCIDIVVVNACVCVYDYDSRSFTHLVGRLVTALEPQSVVQKQASQIDKLLFSKTILQKLRAVKRGKERRVLPRG